MKMTRNEIRKDYKNIIELGYCDLYYTLREYKKIGYNGGVYGWSYDVYMIDYDTVIVTGYRPFGNIHLNYETIEKYNKLDREAKTSEERIELMDQFLKEVI